MEIERKFLIDQSPEIGGDIEHIEIRQGYITRGVDDREVRVRRFGSRYTLGVKSGSGVVREETEIDLSKEQFDALWPLTADARLEKTRYLLREGSNTVELDAYSGKLSGLVVAEVEFGSIEECNDFTAPRWFGREVSGDIAYKNNRLARFGLPAEYQKKPAP
jgi:adenylate cyclase